MSVNIDDIFKSKLVPHTTPPSDGVWDAIQKNLAVNPSEDRSALGSVITVLSMLVITGISVITLHTSTTIPPIGAELWTPKESNIQAESSVSVGSELTPNPAEYFSPTPHAAKVSPTVIPLQTRITAEPTPSSSKTNEGIPTSTLNDRTLKNQELKTDPEATIETEVKPTAALESIETTQKTDLQYEVGDYVVFRIDFENTSTDHTDKLQIWEEFPAWCDASTVETIGHDELHDVKTRTKPGQNTVIWNVKGDFSKHKETSESKGYIEYRIQLTEAKRASELKRNKPQSK